MKLEGYSPLDPRVQEPTITAWRSYRDTFGLEAEEYRLLAEAGKNDLAIKQTLSKRRDALEELLPLWENEWFRQEVD